VTFERKRELQLEVWREKEMYDLILSTMEQRMHFQPNLCAHCVMNGLLLPYHFFVMSSLVYRFFFTDYCLSIHRLVQFVDSYDPPIKGLHEDLNFVSPRIGEVVLMSFSIAVVITRN